MGDAPTASKSKPTIMVPPRGSMGFLFTNGFSPGPMTLVSSLFPENSPFSFSQLLAGAMASPLAAKPAFLPTYDSGKEDKLGDFGKAAAQQQPPPPSQLESMSPLFRVPPPSGLLNSPGYLSPIHSPFGMSHQQALAHVTAQAALSQSFKQIQAEYQHSSSTNFGGLVASRSSSVQTEALAQMANPLPPEPESSKKESSEVSQSDKVTACNAGDKPASDGYNWRKYGQKHVKASECPRSYYKCTHPNCPVKKKVERSLDGRISGITYKGQHNHDPPKPNKREKDACVLDGPTNSHVKSVYVSQNQAETEMLNEVVTANSEPANSHKTLEHRPVSSHNDDTRDTDVVVDVGDAVEPLAKRRNLDIGQSPPASSHQAVGESKIVLQTRSEVDLLDDGYKWRKYGQKVVKGNPHPRSYYRCTYAGCNVRKHVERASADPKSVITTYEGKHNHEIPVGRYSISSQIKAQKEEPSQKDYGSKDQIPTTLQLKEEGIAA